MSRPLFIVLDGPDATGTTTHAKLLAERLEKEGRDVLQTSEPTDGPIGIKIRDYLKSGAIDPLELQMLFTSDREWHVQNVIEPALADGKIVVCDRYWHSTTVYAEAQNIDATELKKINMKFIQPDCVFFTLPPIGISLTRMAKREEKEVFEREELQRTIHDGYRRMAKEHPGIHMIDTSGTKEEVSAQIAEIVEARL